MLEITPQALEKIQELIAQSTEQNEKLVKGLRVGAEARSPLKVDFRLAFIGDGQEEAGDEVLEFAGFDVYVDSESLAYVNDASIDFVDGLMGSGFKVERKHKTVPTASGPAVDRIQQVLEEQINPAVASHGGSVSLIDVKENVVYVELGGGCQGCGMANVTLKQGIEVAIKEAVPEITAVLDVTEHADGTNPYYQPSK
jgi:Fe/S biogenesis protein NfuA